MLTAFHPQMDGQTERRNNSMEQYYWVFFYHQHDDWVKRVPVAEFAANTGISEWTQCTPCLQMKALIPECYL